jgi:hypothetical protein
MVNTMWGTSDRPLLTLAQVRAWQARRHEIGATIKALSDEDADLQRRLEAVQVLMGELPADEATPTEFAEAGADMTEPPQHESGGELFPQTVLNAVTALGGAPLPIAIRQWIKNYGPTQKAKERADTQYFYTCLMRHAARGYLIKVGNGYSLPSSSTQVETGGVVSPGLGSITSPLMTSGPLAAAPKAGGT